VGLWEAFARSLNIHLGEFSEHNINTVVEFAFERYSRTASLIGTPHSCAAVVSRLVEAGVDELGCLIDWMPTEAALQGLEQLQSLRRLQAQAAPSARSLRAHLKAALPEYMLPGHFTFLPGLPLTPNGKLDRKALQSMESPAVQHATASYDDPQGEVECALAQIWKEVLSVERVGRHDNFFELGGHSLLALKLIERMRARGLLIDVQKLFMAPTLSELAGITVRATDSYEGVL